jgi:hypothetical protein
LYGSASPTHRAWDPVNDEASRRGAEVFSTTALWGPETCTYTCTHTYTYTYTMMRWGRVRVGVGVGVGVRGPKNRGRGRYRNRNRNRWAMRFGLQNVFPNVHNPSIPKR